MAVYLRLRYFLETEDHGGSTREGAPRSSSASDLEKYPTMYQMSAFCTLIRNGTFKRTLSTLDKNSLKFLWSECFPGCVSAYTMLPIILNGKSREEYATE